MLEPVGSIVPASHQINLLAGGCIDAVLLVALLAGDRVVAAPLKPHELQERPGHRGVGIRANGERQRHHVVESDAVRSRRRSAEKSRR